MEATATIVKGKILLFLLLLITFFPPATLARRHTTTARSSHHATRSSSHHQGRSSRSQAGSRSRRHETQTRSRSTRGRHRHYEPERPSSIRRRGRHGRYQPVRPLAKQPNIPHDTVNPVEAAGWQGGFPRIYALYDQGLNERLMGNLSDAINDLKKSARLIHMEPSSGKGLTLEAMINFELGRAAEADNNFPLAAEAYEECLKVSPRHIDAAVHLTGALLRIGKPLVALIKARDAVDRSPQDARAHAILAVALDKNGFADDAKLERERANKLLKGGYVPYTPPPLDTMTAPPTNSNPPSESETEMDTDPGAAAPNKSESSTAEPDGKPAQKIPVESSTTPEMEEQSPVSKPDGKQEAPTTPPPTTVEPPPAASPPINPPPAQAPKSGLSPIR